MQNTIKEYFRKIKVLKIYVTVTTRPIFLGYAVFQEHPSSFLLHSPYFPRKEIHFIIRLSLVWPEIVHELFIIPFNQPLSQRTNEPRAPSCVLPWNLKKRFHRMHVKEGRVSIPQFNSCDPQGPDVTPSVIGRVILLLTSNDLSDKSKTYQPHCHLRCPKRPMDYPSPLLVLLVILILNPSDSKACVI